MISDVSKGQSVEEVAEQKTTLWHEAPVAQLVSEELIARGYNFIGGKKEMTFTKDISQNSAISNVEINLCSQDGEENGFAYIAGWTPNSKELGALTQCWSALKIADMVEGCANRFVEGFKQDKAVTQEVTQTIADKPAEGDDKAVEQEVSPKSVSAPAETETPVRAVRSKATTMDVWPGVYAKDADLMPENQGLLVERIAQNAALHTDKDTAIFRMKEEGGNLDGSVCGVTVSARGDQKWFLVTHKGGFYELSPKQTGELVQRIKAGAERELIFDSTKETMTKSSQASHSTTTSMGMH